MVPSRKHAISASLPLETDDRPAWLRRVHPRPPTTRGIAIYVPFLIYKPTPQTPSPSAKHSLAAASAFPSLSNQARRPAERPQKCVKTSLSIPNPPYLRSASRIPPRNVFRDYVRHLAPLPLGPSASRRVRQGCTHPANPSPNGSLPACEPSARLHGSRAWGANQRRRGTAMEGYVGRPGGVVANYAEDMRL